MNAIPTHSTGRRLKMLPSPMKEAEVAKILKPGTREYQLALGNLQKKHGVTLPTRAGSPTQQQPRTQHKGSTGTSSVSTPSTQMTGPASQKPFVTRGSSTAPKPTQTTTSSAKTSTTSPRSGGTVYHGGTGSVGNHGWEASKPKSNDYHKQEQKNAGIIGDHGAKVLLSLTAMKKIWGLTDIADEEWSAIGMVNTDVEGIFIVEDIFLLPQINSAAHTSLDKDAAGKLMLELFQKIGDGVSNLRCWVHSHGTGTVFWSSVDDATIDKYIDPVATPEAFLLSIVVNKSRQMKARLDVYAPVRLTLDQLSVSMGYYDSKDHQELKEQYHKLAKEHVWGNYAGAGSLDPWEDDHWAWYHGVYHPDAPASLPHTRGKTPTSGGGEESSVTVIDEDMKDFDATLRSQWGCYADRWGSWSVCKTCEVETHCHADMVKADKKKMDEELQDLKDTPKAVTYVDGHKVNNCYGDQWANDATCNKCPVSQKCCIEYMKNMAEAGEETVVVDPHLAISGEDWQGCLGEDFDGAGICKTCQLRERCILEMIQHGNAKIQGGAIGDPVVVGDVVIGSVEGYDTDSGEPVIKLVEQQGKSL
jgi:hypothetical protein